MTKPADLQQGDQIVLTITADVTEVVPIDNGTTEIYFSGPFAITVANDTDITKVEPA
jgi:hypothetical protein